jgi:hypothetical protein
MKVTKYIPQLTATSRLAQGTLHTNFPNLITFMGNVENSLLPTF